MIPKIIHQIWEEKTEGSLPNFFSELSQTWRENHPDWKYEFWDKKRMDDFVNKNYPEFCSIYYNYHYDVQRWDSARYLILYKMGGLYVDFDYESLEPIDNILNNNICSFPLEPEEHCKIFHKNTYFSNALIASRPRDPFLKKIIERLTEIGTPTATKNKMIDVFTTTGPLMLTDLYEKYENKNEITLLPSELVSPWSKQEVDEYLAGNSNFNEKY